MIFLPPLARIIKKTALNHPRTPEKISPRVAGSSLSSCSGRVVVTIISSLLLYTSGCAKVTPEPISPVSQKIETPHDVGREVTAPPKRLPPFLISYNRGVTLLDGALRLGKPLKEAERAFEASLTLKPGFFSALYNIAYISYTDARYDDALRNIEAALSYRRTKEAELLKASILKGGKEWDLAVKQYLRVAEKYGNASFAFGQAGEVLMEQQRYEEALILLEKSGKLEEERYQIFINKGTCYLSMVLYEKARDAFGAVYSLGIRESYLLGQYAFSLRKSGDIKGAVTIYEELLKLYPDEIAAYKNVGVIYDLYLDRPDKAIEFYGRYMEMGGRDRARVENWRQIAVDKSKRWFK